MIRLWQLPAETLLALNLPALLPLVGQMHITRPEVLLPNVVARLRAEPDGERRQQLILGFMALLAEEEWIQMVKQILAEDWLIEQSPFLRGIRAESWEEGVRLSQQRAILTVFTARFALSEAVRQQVESHVATQTDEAALSTLLVLAAQSPDLATFLVALTPAEQK